VEVGSPGQKFNVVVDTGSDAIIVPSCTCQRRVCDTRDRCFTGSNRSSTFSVGHVEGTSGEHKEPDFPVITLSFGSGDITVAVTTDVVKVGPAVKATMRNSLLLMLDRDWAMHGPFEGILGLGLPDNNYGSLDPDVAIVELPTGTKREGPSLLKGFLREAGLRRFSLCFNDNSDGALVMGGPPLQGVSLGTIGQLHWGLDFHGVTVGGKKYPAQFCQPGEKRSWQSTACGAIPDSGTTLILAPKKQLDLLLADICDNWERCRSNLTDASLEHKTAMFMTLLDRCTEWVKVPRAEGLQELPDLYFHLAGKNGEEYSLQLTSWAYIIWSEEGTCKPALGTIQYETSINGPIWILGTPIFYGIVWALSLASTHQLFHSAVSRAQAVPVPNLLLWWPQASVLGRHQQLLLKEDRCGESRALFAAQ